MPSVEPIVYVVDDDACIRDVLVRLLESQGFSAKAFGSAEEFLDACVPQMRGCLLLDVRMPEMSGFDLQRCLLDCNIAIPIIFLTGYGDVPSSSQAFRCGAVDFLEKPFDSQQLIDRVNEALERDAQQWHDRMRRAQLQERFARLSAREKDVLKLISAGYTSKQTAKALAISNRTVDVYRAHLMQKMNAESLADLVSMAMELEIGPP